MANRSMALKVERAKLQRIEAGALEASKPAYRNHKAPAYLPVREDKVWKVPEGLTLHKVLRRHF